MPQGSGKKPVIAHSVRTYLHLTQTFIYQYIKNHRQVKPIVLAYRMENLDKFPFKPVYAVYDYPPSSWERFTWWWLWRNLKERVLRLRPDETGFYKKSILDNEVKLLHSHFGPVGVSILPLKRELDLPLVTTFYGFDIKLARLEYWHNMYKELFAEGDLFLVEGEYMQEKLIKLGCPSHKVEIQHIAIDANDYEFMPRSLSRPDDNATVLLCGRFVEKKGISYAIKALGIARKHYSNIKLRVIGDGKLRPYIEKLIKELDLEEQVSLLGFLSHSEYIEELKQAHILIAPSVTAADGDTEGGAPTVLLEAQASGLPVLSTYHADIPNVIFDGESGFLVHERDVEALAERLLYLIEHHGDWRRIGQAGRRHIEANHSIHSEIDRLESRYLDLIG